MRCSAGVRRPTTQPVTLADRTQSEQFLQAAFERTPAEGPLASRTWQDIRAAIVDDTEPTPFLIGIFAVFALVASVFIIANSVTGQAHGQLRDVGLLKAMGMTPR